MVQWQRAMDVAGGLMEAADIYPPRCRVRDWIIVQSPPAKCEILNREERPVIYDQDKTKEQLISELEVMRRGEAQWRSIVANTPVFVCLVDYAGTNQ